MDVSLFATTQLQLLQAEHHLEATVLAALLTSHPPTVLSRAGLALLNLTLSAQRTGFGGRPLLTLSPDPSLSSSTTLPSHSLRPGDVVRVAPQPSGAAKKKEKATLEGLGVEGVVHRVTDTGVTVAVDEKSGDEGVEKVSGTRLWVVKRGDEVTHKRMVKAVERLKELGEQKQETQLMRVLFGHADPGTLEAVGGIEWGDEGLNESQKEAVKFALGAPDIGELFPSSLYGVCRADEE